MVCKSGAEVSARKSSAYFVQGFLFIPTAKFYFKSAALTKRALITRDTRRGCAAVAWLGFARLSSEAGVRY